MAKGYKTGGREKGTPNKITTNLREMVNGFLSNNWGSIQSDFNKLEPKEKLLFYEKLLQYGLPKLQSTELTGNIDRLSDEQLNRIIDELKASIK